jgi:hypothetical protein
MVKQRGEAKIMAKNGNGGVAAMAMAAGRRGARKHGVSKRKMAKCENGETEIMKSALM